MNQQATTLCSAPNAVLRSDSDVQNKQLMEHYNIVIATPGSSMHPAYVESLVKTLRWLESKKMTYLWLNKYSSFVPSARELTATDTYVHDWQTNQIGSGRFTYDVIVWIDSDISWEIPAISELIKSPHHITGGLYQTAPDGTVAVAMDNGQGLPRKFNKVECLLWEDPFEAWGVGFGFVAMTTGVFEKIPRPWFEIEKIRWPENNFDTNVGEDYSWCVRARRAGFKVMVDPRIKVKHHKDVIYVVE